MHARIGRREAVVGIGTLLALRSANAAEMPQRGGTLTVAMDLEPASLDPLFGNASSDRFAFNLFAENLVVQAEDGSFQPMLAESWETAADGGSILFRLRPGVRFHDGTAMDAEAVKFNLDRVIDPAVNARARQFAGNLAGTDVVGPMQVRVRMKTPSAAFLSVLALEAGSILSPTAVKALGADFARKPVGTGPFKVTGWSGGRIESERFDGYWGKGADGKSLPYLDRVVVRVISNTAVKILELKAGTIQLGDSIQIKDFDQIERDPNLTLLDTVQGTLQYMAFNVTRPPFDNLELRKAVSLAINRPALEKVVSRGQGIAAAGLEPPGSQAYGKDIRGHVLDLAAAKAAYAKSGHTGPLTLSVIQRDPDTQIAQILQSMLKAAGIELKVEVLERQAWLDKVLGRTYQLGILRGTLPRPDPDLTFANYYGPAAKQNYSGFKEPEIAALVEKAAGELNADKRRALYVEVQQRILDSYYETYLLFRPNKQVRRNTLQGFAREFNVTWLYQGMWLKQGA